MLLITFEYIPIQLNVAFLAIKEEEVSLWFYPIAFFTHVYSSIFCLVFGFFQFLDWIRLKYKVIHKYLGSIYIFVVLFLSGPSGLLMSIFANGGLISRISFTLLSLLWMYFTFMGYRSIKNKDISSHEKWMIRSYSLTLSALSLRFFKWLIACSLNLPPMDIYRIVSILGWTFYLLIAEIIIYQFYRKKY